MRLSSQTNTNTLGKCTCGNAVGLLTDDIDAERCPNWFVCQSYHALNERGDGATSLQVDMSLECLQG